MLGTQMVVETDQRGSPHRQYLGHFGITAKGFLDETQGMAGGDQTPLPPAENRIHIRKQRERSMVSRLELRRPFEVNGGTLEVAAIATAESEHVMGLEQI